MSEYIVSSTALETLESGGAIGLSSFGPDGYRMIMHDYLMESDPCPGDGWRLFGDDEDEEKQWEYPLREIVRCRDCENYEPMDGTLFNCRFEINGFIQWRNAEPDGFCAWGERRAE